MKKDKRENPEKGMPENEPVKEETPDIDDGAMEAQIVDEGEPQPQKETEAAAEAGIAEWQAALELAVKQRDELKDQLLRSQADFQNFKRRNQTARSDGYEDGVREAITAVLPAIDNMERAIEAAEKHGGGEKLVEGVKMTLNTLTEGLKRFGFEEVPALGEPFDPEKHNAVMREVADDPGKVLEVFEKGYRVKDRIIRYAMVKVSVEE